MREIRSGFAALPLRLPLCSIRFVLFPRPGLPLSYTALVADSVSLVLMRFPFQGLECLHVWVHVWDLCVDIHLV